jgi:phage gpG-like protein
MRWNVTVNGVRQTLSAFLKVQGGIIDLRKLGAWDQVQGVFYKIQREQFGSEGGGKWAALSPPYAKVKLSRFGAKPILQATGKMFEEFTSDQGNVQKDAQSMSFKFGPPAAFHMSTRARTKMPYRSTLELDDDHKRRLTEPLKQKIKQLIQNARLASKRGF